MGDVVFEEIECRSSVHRVQAASMPFRWALNPYRTGPQTCGYCADGEAAGESRVVVSVNAPEVLRRDLARPEWRREAVAIGIAGEPYHAAELKYSLTHRLLKVMRDASNPTILFTRSALVVRDADVLLDLCSTTDSAVALPMATLDDEISRRIEPASDSVERRLRTMDRLASAGVRCGVLLAPIAPGLTDDAVGLERVLDAARAHGASFVHPNPLYVRPGAREWSMPLLRESYPHLADRYAAYYRGPHGSRSYALDVLRMIDALRDRCGLAWAGATAQSPGQLQLAM